MIALKVNNRLLLKCLNVAVTKEVSWQLHCFGKLLTLGMNWCWQSHLRILKFDGNLCSLCKQKYPKEKKKQNVFPFLPQMAPFLGCCPTNMFIETKPKKCSKPDIAPKFSIRKMIQRHSVEKYMSKARYILIALVLK